jgi:2-phosphosulfolactate phosphatase
VEASLIAADCYVAVDMLRATTTIATMFARGLRDLVAVNSLDYAYALAKAEGRLLAGEVKGLPPAGFDLGNSPVDASEAELAGRGGVLFTTNGTAALCTLAARGHVIAGAIANATATAEAIAEFEHVCIVCAGNEGGLRFALEDFAAAGAIISRVQRLHPGAELGDAAGLAITQPGYENWLAVGLPQQTGASARMIAGSEHGQKLASLGLAGDIHFAAQADTSAAAPTVVDFGDGWARLVDAAKRS